MSKTMTVSTILAAIAALTACSSTTGPGSTQQASTAGDQYGYQFESDSAKQAAVATGAPAPATNAQGRLAPEAIQGVVRQSFGAFRQCYENALKANAQLQGTVTVSFVIAPDGSVQAPSDHGSTLPDANVVGCVVSGFGKLSFPSPQGGHVTVVYPIAFSPGD